MVEMQEVANILHNSTEKSFVIIDEVWRGTSTYDGMSLAWAILKENHDNIKARTLFATHYHELTSLADKYKAIQNVHMAIKEDLSSSKLTFLYTLKQGPTNDSYGIQVAQLAGLPKKVIQKAQKVLKGLEKSRPKIHEIKQLSLLDQSPPHTMKDERGDFITDDVKLLVEQVKNTSVQKMTPLDALNQISKWQQDLS